MDLLVELASLAHQACRVYQEQMETQDPKVPKVTEVSLVCKGFQDLLDPLVTKDPWATQV